MLKSLRKHKSVTSAAKAALILRGFYGTAEAVPLSKTGSEVQAKSVAADAPYAPEMIQTVATERQVTADGRVLVTRMVMVRAYNVSNPDASESVPDVQESQPTQKLQQVVHRYAAVPVQGGWLVFQL